jgi:hypothetical protein
LPVIDTKIICKVDLLNKALIKASNGPIVCIIGINYINDTNFTINNKGDIVHSMTNKEIKINDYISINIRGTNFFPGDERIVILGNLEDIVSEKDIKDFYEEDLDVEQILEDNVDNIDSSDNESDSDLNTNEVLNDNYVNL